jgi:hypothetical protein
VSATAAGRLPGWMRTALVATAVMNGVAGVAFLPGSARLRALVGFPEGDPFYLATVALFVLLFGAGYAWVGLTGRAERLFIGLAAAGKIAFVGLLATYAAAGALPWRAFAAGSGDLVFGVAFAAWLAATRPSGR